MSPKTLYEVWAEAAAELMKGPPPSAAEAVADLKSSPMDMARALDDLLVLHGQACPERAA